MFLALKLGRDARQLRMGKKWQVITWAVSSSTRPQALLEEGEEIPLQYRGLEGNSRRKTLRFENGGREWIFSKHFEDQDTAPKPTNRWCFSQ